MKLGDCNCPVHGAGSASTAEAAAFSASHRARSDEISLEGFALDVKHGTRFREIARKVPYLFGKRRETRFDIRFKNRDAIDL